MTAATGHHTWCKVCGITSLKDAQVSEQAGADALGFNCYPASPRFVSVEQIAELSRAVKVTSVALFVDPSAAEVEAVLAAGEIDLLQFQGEEDEDFCTRFGLPYMKGVRMRPGVDVAELAAEFHSAWALLLDAYVEGKPGGTGITFDWQQWPELSGRRLVLAGGLTVDNVAGAIKQLMPFGVDVCGGLETAQKGVKDHKKVNRFLQEVRSVSGG